MHQTVGWEEFVLRTKLKATHEQKEEQKVKTSHKQSKRKQGREKKRIELGMQQICFCTNLKQ